jgi:hypothetical protein
MSIANSEDKDWGEVLMTTDIEEFKYHKVYCKFCDNGADSICWLC